VAIRVLLVDDQPLMRTGFSMVLGAEPDIEVVGEAADGATSLTQAAALNPDVVLMDIRMPGMDGIEATRRLVASGSAAKVIILTTFDLDEYAFAGLAAGASGFLSKDARPGELLAAIRAVAAGDASISPRVTKRMLELFANRLPKGGQGEGQAEAGSGIGPDMASLTAKERETFDLLAAGLANGEIAERLTVSEATVKSHVAAVLRKLGLRDRVQVVVYAYDNGLVEPGHGLTLNHGLGNG
jgi:DNA-binding NarL/FixJ family response regulator